MIAEAVIENSNRLHRWLDNQRVKLHFRRVDRILRKTDTTEMPAFLHDIRLHNLDVLKRYAKHGVFPRNYDNPELTPVFIDREGRLCAVAHLLTESGQERIATTISQQANFARVPEIDFAELDQWATESGFTRDELALIQPAYAVFHLYHVFTPLLWMTLISIAATIISFRIRPGLLKTLFSVVVLALSIQALVYMPELMLLGPSIKADYLPHIPMSLWYHHIYHVRFFFLHPFTDLVAFKVVENHSGPGGVEIILGICMAATILNIAYSARNLYELILTRRKPSQPQEAEMTISARAG